MGSSMRAIMDAYLAKGATSSAGVSDMKPEDAKKADGYFSVVRNIPHTYHSKDLRAFFSDFVENGRFDCFHFRHRVEVKETSGDARKNTFCCVVKFGSEETRSSFIRTYHRSNWINSAGLLIPLKCFIQAIKCQDTPGPSTSAVDEQEELSASDLHHLIELRPPAAMPKGNVGTPSSYFLDQISLCKLPASLIPKLGLKTGRRKRKFDSVLFDYGEGRRFGATSAEASSSSRVNVPDIVDTRRRQFLNEKMSKKIMGEQEEPDAETDDPTDIAVSRLPPDNDDLEGEDDDQCEEWERHEALHDDVTEHERTKEKKFEEEMEVVWEKGGPGLVWKMDKEFWDEREKGTDCDWKWTDDWDVDYSVYYEGKSAGTKDARDAVEIREDEARRSGSLHESVFWQKSSKGGGKLSARKRRNSDTEASLVANKVPERIGEIMKRMGWAPGKGLGREGRGRVDPVAIQMGVDSNIGNEKTGFGYRGEKLQRTGFMKVPQRHGIVSKFDEYKDREEAKFSEKRLETEGEVLWRRKETTFIKHKS